MKENKKVEEEEIGEDKQEVEMVAEGEEEDAYGDKEVEEDNKIME